MKANIEFIDAGNGFYFKVYKNQAIIYEAALIQPWNDTCEFATRVIHSLLPGIDAKALIENRVFEG